MGVVFYFCSHLPRREKQLLLSLGNFLSSEKKIPTWAVGDSFFTYYNQTFCLLEDGQRLGKINGVLVVYPSCCAESGNPLNAKKYLFWSFGHSKTNRNEVDIIQYRNELWGLGDYLVLGAEPPQSGMRSNGFVIIDSKTKDTEVLLRSRMTEPLLHISEKVKRKDRLLMFSYARSFVCEFPEDKLHLEAQIMGCPSIVRIPKGVEVDEFLTAQIRPDLVFPLIGNVLNNEQWRIEAGRSSIDLKGLRADLNAAGDVIAKALEKAKREEVSDSEILGGREQDGSLDDVALKNFSLKLKSTLLYKLSEKLSQSVLGTAAAVFFIILYFICALFFTTVTLIFKSDRALKGY